MNNWEMEYPLKQCESCIHNRVCRFTDMLSDPELPINLENAQCDEYISDEEVLGSVEAYEDTSGEFLADCTNRLKELIAEEEPKQQTEILPIEQIKDEFVNNFLLAIDHKLSELHETGAIVKSVILNPDDLDKIQKAWGEDTVVHNLQTMDGRDIAVLSDPSVPKGVVMYDLSK